MNLAQILGLFSAFLFILVLTFTDERWQLWIQLAHFCILLVSSVLAARTYGMMGFAVASLGANSLRVAAVVILALGSGMWWWLAERKQEVQVVEIAQEIRGNEGHKGVILRLQNGNVIDLEKNEGEVQVGAGGAVANKNGLLLAYKEIEEKKFIEQANQLFEKESSQELYFVSLGCFQKSTLYLLPVYNEFLNQLILKIYQTFDEYVSISQKNRYLPYHFVPHVSISRKLNEQQTNQAFKILNHYFEPFYGKVIQVALVKTNPYQEIKIWNL